MLIRVNWKITKNMRMRRRILEPGKEFLIQDNYFEGFLNPEKRVKDSEPGEYREVFLNQDNYGDWRMVLVPGEYREGFLNLENTEKDSKTWRIQRRILEPGEYREGC